MPQSSARCNRCTCAVLTWGVPWKELVLFGRSASSTVSSTKRPKVWLATGPCWETVVGKGFPCLERRSEASSVFKTSCVLCVAFYLHAALIRQVVEQHLFEQFLAIATNFETVPYFNKVTNTILISTCISCSLSRIGVVVGCSMFPPIISVVFGLSPNLPPLMRINVRPTFSTRYSHRTTKEKNS